MSDSVQKTAERPEKVRLWNRDFVLIIFINFLVFMKLVSRIVRKKFPLSPR